MNSRTIKFDRNLSDMLQCFICICIFVLYRWNRWKMSKYDYSMNNNLFFVCIKHSEKHAMLIAHKKYNNIIHNMGQFWNGFTAVVWKQVKWIFDDNNKSIKNLCIRLQSLSICSLSSWNYQQQSNDVQFVFNLLITSEIQNWKAKM